jgi:hypothetical protein
MRPLRCLRRSALPYSSCTIFRSCAGPIPFGLQLISWRISGDSSVKFSGGILVDPFFLWAMYSF